jgi:hypothetical protein
VVIGVGSGLALVKMGWWDPLGVTVFELAGFPATGGDELVMRGAALGQIVDVSCPARGVVGDVMHFGEVAGHIAIGKRAAAVFGGNVEVMHCYR